MYADNFKVLREISVETFGAGAELVRPAEVAVRVAAGSMTGNEVAVFGRYWGQELPLPRPRGAAGAASRKYYVDWIPAASTFAAALSPRCGTSPARRREACSDGDGDLAELTAVEVQTVDTTGNYSDQAQSFFRNHWTSGVRARLHLRRRPLCASPAPQSRTDNVAIAIVRCSGRFRYLPEAEPAARAQDALDGS